MVHHRNYELQHHGCRSRLVLPLKRHRPEHHCRSYTVKIGSPISVVSSVHRVKTTYTPLAPAKLVQITSQAVAAPTSSEADAKAFIYFHESTNRTNAVNASSGACGLGQALPCSKLPCSLSDYQGQDAWVTGYAMLRYGSWSNAQAFWQANHYW
jgi:hypothetical protein